MKNTLIVFGTFALAAHFFVLGSANAANPCESNDPNNVMVQVGSWCVDKFAGIICDSAKLGPGFSDSDFFGSCVSRLNNNNGVEPQYQIDVQNAAHNEAGNQLPNVITHDGKTMTVNSYKAYSIDPLDPRLGNPANAVAIETRFITFPQAQKLCEQSGKEPLPENIWNLAAAGTTPCKIEKGTDICLSTAGVQGMLGHMWELTYLGQLQNPDVIVKGDPTHSSTDPIDVVFDFSPTPSTNGQVVYPLAHEVTFRCGKIIGQ